MRNSLRHALEIGTAMWPRCYKGGRSDMAAHQAVVARVNESIGSGVVAARDVTRVAAGVPNGTSAPAVDESLVTGILCAAKWVDGGCRAITSDSRYFAAMSQTVAAGAAADIVVPWDAFSLSIPRGLLLDADGREYTTAFFAQFKCPTGDETGAYGIGGAYYDIVSEDGCSIHAYWQGLTLAELLFGRDPVTDPRFGTAVRDAEEGKSDARIRELVKRATVGLLYTMQHTPEWRPDSACDIAGRSSRGRSGPPNHRTILVGRPLALDVRSAVRADARSGNRSAPSVQTLVRGHIKRQAFGVGRADRRLVWIEPYWRGPEDAPILARPYQVAAEVE